MIRFYCSYRDYSHVSHDLKVSRGGQSVTVVGTTLVVFGGQDAKRSLLNDLHILDFETMTWDEMDTVYDCLLICATVTSTDYLDLLFAVLLNICMLFTTHTNNFPLICTSYILVVRPIGVYL